MGLFNDDAELARLEDRLRRVEDKLDRILEHLGLQKPAEEEDWMSEVRSLLADNLKIAAIKLYRERTGTGLAEAKRAVEALE